MRAATGKERLDWELVWLMLKQENMSCNKQAQLQNREFLGLRRQRRTEWLRITAPQKFPECVCEWEGEWVSEWHECVCVWEGEGQRSVSLSFHPLTHIHTHVTHTHGKATSIFSQASQCFHSHLPAMPTDTPIHDTRYYSTSPTSSLLLFIYLLLLFTLLENSSSIFI